MNVLFQQFFILKMHLDFCNSYFIDMLSPFIFLRTVIIFEGAFPLALWILLPWVLVLLFLTFFICVPQIEDRLVIVSSFLCEMP